MKRSSLVVLTGVLVAIITIAAADLKLNQEYKQKNIKESLIYTDLPEFHYVKDDFNGKFYYEWYFCNISADKKYGVGADFAAQSILKFFVKNDTLFIQKSDDAAINDVAFGIPLKIYCPTLKGAFAGSCEMNIIAPQADSLTISATNKGKITIQNMKGHYLDVSANNTASVSLSGNDTLHHLDLNLKSTSSFAVSNVFIESRNFHISDSASLQFSGRSLQNFGIKMQ